MYIFLIYVCQIYIYIYIYAHILLLAIFEIIYSCIHLLCVFSYGNFADLCHYFVY